MGRPFTPAVLLGESGRVARLERTCTGCARAIGPALPAEWNAARAGQRLPDTRWECRSCAPWTAAMT